MTVFVPVFNQINDSKGILHLLRTMTSNDVIFHIIDNGSKQNEDYEKLYYKYIKPKRFDFTRNEQNIGLVKTMQQAYELCQTELLAIIHNDVFIYEKDWDKRIAKYFEIMPRLGAAGFFGAQGCGPRGERIQDVPRVDIAAGMGNMLEAEIHGLRMTEEYRPAAFFDGLAMIFRMDMLRAGNGFDQRYTMHHIYDRDASLESLRRGYDNIVVNVPVHHLSGLTANRSDFQEQADQLAKTTGFTGDKYFHDSNSDLFQKKWESVTPLYVEDDFSFRTGTQSVWQYKGDAIRSLGGDQ